MGQEWDATSEIIEPESEMDDVLQCRAKGKRVEIMDMGGWSERCDIDRLREAVKKLGRRIATWDDFADFPWPRGRGRNE